MKQDRSWERRLRGSDLVLGFLIIEWDLLVWDWVGTWGNLSFMNKFSPNIIVNVIQNLYHIIYSTSSLSWLVFFMVINNCFIEWAEFTWKYISWTNFAILLIFCLFFFLLWKRNKKYLLWRNLLQCLSCYNNLNRLRLASILLSFVFRERNTNYSGRNNLSLLGWQLDLEQK